MTAESQQSPQRFEASLAELESIVDTLEKGELPLEESLAAFERGIRLTRTCQQVLDEAEQKVRILSGKSVEAGLTPFEENG